MLAADRLREACMELLDEEDEDEVIVTQVTSVATDLEPTETLLILIRARNALIRTRIKDCYVEAQALDKIIHGLSRHYSQDIEPQYDYGKFMEVAEAILTRGEDPV